MSAKPDYVVNTLTRPAGAAAKGGYVINLTSSTTPMALSQPKDPTLAQYTFFVSRRREDGRERFRLHMGYFETCLLYTSPSPRDGLLSRMPSSA